MPARTYTAEQRAEAIGLALSLGPVRAGRQLHIPARTVARWGHSKEAAVLRLQTKDDLARKLWEGVAVGVEQVLHGLKDPHARLSDKARALEVLSTQHALLTGEATARTENLNLNADAEDMLPAYDAHKLLEFVRDLNEASDDELREWAANGGLAMIRDAEKMAAEGPAAIERARAKRWTEP